MGQIHHQMSNFQAADAAFARAEVYLPDDSTVAFHRGMNAAALKHTTQAIGHWTRALKLDPFNVEPAIQLAAWPRQRGLETAKSHLEKAHRLILQHTPCL